MVRLSVLGLAVLARLAAPTAWAWSGAGSVLAGRRPQGRQCATALGYHMPWHARDPWGVKHVETRPQARNARNLLEAFQNVFSQRLVKCLKLGDMEMQTRIRIDDVIMANGCNTAYIHVSADGSELEKRQAFVWLTRNKGLIKSAVLQRYWEHRYRLPSIYWVESQWDTWESTWMRARKYPELGLPHPYQTSADFLPEVAKAMHTVEDRRAKFADKKGVGDAKAKYPAWGYPTETVQ